MIPKRAAYPNQGALLFSFLFLRLSAVEGGLLLVFLFRGHSAADVAFLLVLIQHRPGLGVELGMDPAQAAGDVLVDSGFGNAEVSGGGPDGGTGFNDVHSQFTGSLLHWFCHIATSDAVC